MESAKVASMLTQNLSKEEKNSNFDWLAQEETREFKDGNHWEPVTLTPGNGISEGKTEAEYREYLQTRTKFAWLGDQCELRKQKITAYAASRHSSANSMRDTLCALCMAPGWAVWSVAKLTTLAATTTLPAAVVHNLMAPERWDAPGGHFSPKGFVTSMFEFAWTQEERRPLLNQAIDTITLTTAINFAGNYLWNILVDPQAVLWLTHVVRRLARQTCMNIAIIPSLAKMVAGEHLSAILSAVSSCMGHVQQAKFVVIAILAVSTVLYFKGYTPEASETLREACTLVGRRVAGKVCTATNLAADRLADAAYNIRKQLQDSRPRLKRSAADPLASDTKKQRTGVDAVDAGYDLSIAMAVMQAAIVAYG